MPRRTILVGNHQSVATREKHVANGWSLLNVLKCFLNAVVATLGVGLTSKTAASAVTAVHRAHVGNEEQHAVGITVSQAGCGRVLVFVQRVEKVGTGLMSLKTSGNALLAHWVVGVIGIDEAQVVRSDCHAQSREGLFHALFFLSGKADVLLQVLESLDAVLYLPFPVVPLLIGNIGKELFSS